MTSTLHMAALLGEPVTEGHVRICGERGHATHTVNGVDQQVCPRCGHVEPVTDPRIDKLAQMEAWRADPQAFGMGYGCTYVSLPRLIAELRAQIAAV